MMNPVKFGDVVQEIKINIDRSTDDHEFFIAGEHMDSNNIHITRRGEFAGSDVGPAFIRLFRPGQVLYGSRRTYLKKVAVADFEGITSNTTFVLETKDSNKLMQELLPYIMLTDRFSEYAINHSKGSTNPYILFKDLAAYEFILPSIEEQRHLANLLAACDRAKEAYKRLLKQTDEVLKSQFIEMFGDPLVNPLGWEKFQLQQLVSKDCSISYGIVKTGDDVEEGVPVFRPVDIVGKVPTRAGLKRTTSDISNQYKRSILTGRDLLITVRANIADTFIAGDEFIGCNVGRGIVPIRTDESKIRLEFLKAQMDFDSINRHMKSLAKGIALIQLNIEDLRSVEFIVPPTEDQDRYISFWQQSDKSKFELNQAITRIDNLIKSLMQEHNL